ncbi:hypothetical protein GCM10010187_24680 [Actinomadura coerulea]|nr:hypothetical protein GCM10010187_24680 [Actinomadura coerulea]
MDALSIETQLDRGHKWATVEGYDVAAEYTENVSAWTGKARPQIDRAMDDLIAGRIDVLWCYALDRFTRRGARMILEIMDQPASVRPWIIFDHEQMNTRNDAYRLPLIMLAEMALQYSDRLSKNVRSTFHRMRESGDWTGRAPYGTRVRAGTRKLEPDPDTWPHIMEAYTAVGAGVSLRAVAVMFNERGVPSPRGTEWASRTLWAMIHHPAYEGLQVAYDGGKPYAYRDAHGHTVRAFADDAEALPADLVRAARTALSGRSFDMQGKRGTASAELTGTMHCQGCGGPMARTGKAYRCSRHIRGVHCPNPATVQAHHVEPMVREAFLAYVTALDPADPDDLDTWAEIATRWKLHTDPTIVADNREATRAVTDLEKRLRRLRDDREAGLYDDDPADYARRVRDLQDALKDARDNAGDTGVVNLPDFAGMEYEELSTGLMRVSTAERRALLSSAIAGVIVNRAPRGTQRFDPDRVRIVLVSGEDIRR